MPLLMSAFLLALTSCVKKKQQLPKAEVKQEIKQPEISPLDSVIRHACLWRRRQYPKANQGCIRC